MEKVKEPLPSTHGTRGVDLDWPWYIPMAAAVSAVLTMFAALVQRGALFPPGVETLAALVAVSPWLVEHATGWAPPRWLMALVTSAAVPVLLVIDAPDGDFAPFVLVIMASEVGATGSHLDGLLAVLMSAAVMLGIELTTDYTGAAIWVAGIVAGFGFGHGMQIQLRLQTAERERQSGLLARAATDERQRIAREIHDVIAHSLSVTMLHLTGARHALESGADPAEAAGALRDAERLGRQAMNDIRRTVGLLAPAAGGETAPMPGAADIEVLVAEFATAGLDVRYEVEGDPSTVSLATGLGLYRIAQESLANVARHAPGAPTAVRLDVTGDEIAFVVRNASGNGAGPLAGAPEVGGLGLRGMEERARLLGGSLRAGPDDGGWVVDVRVPRAAAPPAGAASSCG